VLWAAELAARLRLLQASLADEPAPAREQALAAAVTAAMQALPPDQCGPCIEALAAEFPGPQGSRPPLVISVAPEPPPPPSPPPPDDPVALAKKLAAMAPKMSPEQVSAVTLSLARSGLMRPPAPGGAVKVPDELAERLEKLVPGKPLDHRRALRMLDVLIEVYLSVDQIVWQVWKAVAPKSVIHKEPGLAGDIRKAIGPYLTGDTEVSGEQVRQIVEKTRKLVAGLLGALGLVGETYAVKLLCHIAPDAIRKAAEADHGVFENIERKCWRKYTAIFEELNGPAIEKDVLASVKKHTEKLILGTDAASELED
jgi:hypothetical protein